MAAHIALVVFLYVLLTVARAPAIWGVGRRPDGANPWAKFEPRISANLSNQFEWPVFFYAACLILLQWQHSGAALALAWVFVAGRVVHSLVQILTSNVRLRGVVFTINFVAVLGLWVLIACPPALAAQPAAELQAKAASGDQEALKALLEQAEQGDAMAQASAAMLYAAGQGVTKDLREAEGWMRKAADQGLGFAQYAMGILYFNGDGGLPEDRGQAVQWWLKAAEQGVPNAQVLLAKLYEDGDKRAGIARDYAQAERWYKAAEASTHRKDVQSRLGSLYQYAEGSFQNIEQAAHWYRKAAEQGDANAQVGLAELYVKGEGVARDYAQALSWYRKAIEQNDARAWRGLGAMHQNGYGLPQDYRAAMQAYRKAIEFGASIDTPNDLAALYANGWGVAQNKVAAYALYTMSLDEMTDSSYGYDVATQGRAALAEKMTPAQIGDAKALAYRFRWEPAPQGTGMRAYQLQILDEYLATGIARKKE
jgi:TPR repeat protein